jgi:hypothetical protein
MMDNEINVHDSEQIVANELENTPLEETSVEEKATEIISQVTSEEPVIAETPIEEHEEEHELNEESEDKDYSLYTKEQLLAETEILAKETSFRKIDGILRLLKIEIDRINREEKETLLKKYVEAGGEEDGFVYKQDAVIEKFYANYKALKEKKAKYFSDQEKKRHRNLEVKNDIIKQIKTIVESGDTTKQSIDQLKELQKKWKETGVVPPSETEKLYETYNALLDRFYSQKNIDNQLVELDRKKNLEAKNEICRKAEALLDLANINDAIAQLNKLHEEYRSIGHVPREEQEALWQRFKTASDKLYDKKRSFLDGVKKRLEENMKQKQELCLKIEGFPEFNSDRISDWNQKTKEILALQEEWDRIGPAPREVAKDINKQFWGNFKSFFNNKGRFFEKLEKQRDENLKQKIALCEQAEAVKESNEWDETSDTLKKLQEDWKGIGPVPEAQRDSIYERFKAACDHFFNRKRNRKSSQDQEFEVNLTKKKEVCEAIEKMAKEKEADINKLLEQLDNWLEIGFVPRKSMNSIQDRIAKAIDTFINAMPISSDEKEKQRFNAQIKLMGNAGNSDRKMIRKEQTLRKRINAIENDIALWKNNLEFFAQSKTADKLRLEFNSKIAEATKELESLKLQLRVLQNM